MDLLGPRKSPRLSTVVGLPTGQDGHEVATPGKGSELGRAIRNNRMAAPREDQSKVWDDYERRQNEPSPAAEPLLPRPSIADVPNGWDEGVIPDNSVPANLRGNICSGVNKPKSLKRYADE